MMANIQLSIWNQTKNSCTWVNIQLSYVTSLFLCLTSSMTYLCFPFRFTCHFEVDNNISLHSL